MSEPLLLPLERSTTQPWIQCEDSEAIVCFWPGTMTLVGFELVNPANVICKLRFLKILILKVVFKVSINFCSAATHIFGRPFATKVVDSPDRTVLELS